jgi:hypothetical protein
VPPVSVVYVYLYQCLWLFELVWDSSYTIRSATGYSQCISGCLGSKICPRDGSDSLWPLTAEA